MIAYVEVFRTWGDKKVYTRVCDRTENTEIVCLSVTLDDFLDAMIKEIDSVTWVFTQAEFQKRMLAARDKVLEEIKKTTAPHAQSIPVD